MFNPWTDEEDKMLLDLATGEISYKKISEIIKTRSEFACQVRGQRLKIKNPYKKRTIFYDKNFWSEPNPINCYWAGFSAADASVTRRNGGIYSLEIHERDLHHLQKLTKYINFTGKIRQYRKKSFLEYKESNLVKISVSSGKQWLDDLEKNFNIIPNKTYRLGPPNNLDEYLSWCYFIGLCDGDGTVCFTNEKDRQGVTISVTSCSNNILFWIKDLIGDKFKGLIKSSSNVYSCGKDINASKISFGGVKAMVIIDFLSKFDVPMLDRKFKNEKILNFIKDYKQKYPHLFTYQCPMPPQYQPLVEKYNSRLEVPKIFSENSPVQV